MVIKAAQHTLSTSKEVSMKYNNVSTKFIKLNDIYPKIKNVSRGTERIVISDTGSSAWYTSDHYKTFVRLLTK